MIAANDVRESSLAGQPNACFITDHYRNYPTVLIRLAAVTPAVLKQLLIDAWRRGAPRRVLEEHPELSGA